jgi:NADH-quinone oxidoreductase subunit E
MTSPGGTAEITQDEPGFPVRFGGTKEPCAAFREESRIRGPFQRGVQEIRGQSWGQEIMSTQIKTIFSPALAARFDRMVTLYPLRRSALIPMLLYAQDEVGYLSPPVISEVAARIGITELDVRDVITYYSLMRTAPAGKYHVQVCTNISCMLRGGNELLAHCKQRLGIGNKETTPDKVFSLEEVECIGACSWAPAVQVNYDFHENLTADSMDKILEDYRSRN